MSLETVISDILFKTHSFLKQTAREGYFRADISSVSPANSRASRAKERENSAVNPTASIR